MRRWRAKRDSSLPPLVQDNFASHIFGKPSVDAQTDIRVGPLIKNDFNRSYLEEQQEKQAQLKLEMIKHNMKNKDQSNKVSRLRSQSVAKKMQQREIESFDFQTKVREQQEANRKGKSPNRSPFTRNQKLKDGLDDDENQRLGSKDGKRRQTLDLDQI